MQDRTRLTFDLLTVDRASDEPMHRQIYGAIRRLIHDGRLPAGASLPATRALAEDLGVGRNTVIAAYDQLLAEGYVEARTGSGTRVAQSLSEASLAAPDGEGAPGRRLSRRGEVMTRRPQPARHAGAINVHPGVPDIASFPFAVWTSLITRNARSRDASLNGYLSFAGHDGLRRAIATSLGVSRGIDCKPEQVIIVTGAQAALDLVSRVLMDDGDTVWMEEPGYLGARSAFLAGGGRPHPLLVDRQGWNLGDPSLPPPRLVYVTPSCQWPFGTVMRIEERLQLLDIARRHDAFIVEDDYDGEYRFRGSPVPALRGLDKEGRVIYIGSFGKTLLQAIRIGYLIVPMELADAFGKAVSITGQFAPLLLQATVHDFIEQGHFARHLKRMRRLYARRQGDFVRLCEEHLGRWITVSENDSGMQVFARFRAPWDDRDVVAAALEQGLDVQSVSMNYHVTRPEHGLLLGYAAHDQRQALRIMHALKAAFERIESAGNSSAT